jgi:hypothetical protein
MKVSADPRPQPRTNSNLFGLKRVKGPGNQHILKAPRLILKGGQGLGITVFSAAVICVNLMNSVG